MCVSPPATTVWRERAQQPLWSAAASTKHGHRETTDTLSCERKEERKTVEGALRRSERAGIVMSTAWLCARARVRVQYTLSRCGWLLVR